MDKGNKDLRNRTLQMKFKELIKKSKEKGLIKPHTEAYKDFPVENEEHKGNKTSFCR